MTQAENLRGGMIVTFSMAVFSVEDALIKDLASRYPVGQVMLMLGLGGATVFFVIAGDAGRRAILRGFRSGTLMLRNLGECLGAATYTAALALVSFSTVAAVFQATPLAITAAAAVFLGEKVGWRRWSAVAAGFVGVLMIIRPGLAGFEPAAGLVLVTVVAIAFRDIITRKIPAGMPSGAVACHGFLSVAATGAVFLALSGGFTPPAASDLGKIAAAVAAGTAGYYAIVAAMRIGDTSALMPYRYSRLVFSLIIGVTVFAERPDAPTLAGAGLILGAAFYTFLRERRIARRAAAAAAE